MSNTKLPFMLSYLAAGKDSFLSDMLVLGYIIESSQMLNGNMSGKSYKND
jgi:hypothetical protein